MYQAFIHCIPRVSVLVAFHDIDPGFPEKKHIKPLEDERKGIYVSCNEYIANIVTVVSANPMID